MPDHDETIDAAGLTPAERRILQSKADKAEEMEARALAAERRLALVDAGLTLSEKQRKALEATHEGDWTPEALRASAAELGFAEAPPPPSNVPPEELAALGRINDASLGAEVRPPSADAELDAQMAQLRADVQAGRLSPEAASQKFDALYRSHHPERMAIH